MPDLSRIERTSCRDFHDANWHVVVCRKHVKVMFCFALGSLLHMVSQMIYDLCACFYAERSGAKAWKDLISVTHLLREDETIL